MSVIRILEQLKETLVAEQIFDAALIVRKKIDELKAVKGIDSPLDGIVECLKQDTSKAWALYVKDDWLTQKIISVADLEKLTEYM